MQSSQACGPDSKFNQLAGSNCDMMTSASLKSNDMQSYVSKDTMVTDQNDNQSIFSPPPSSHMSSSDEFGGLKKGEAIDLFFKRLN